jgi:hypothetical protein
MRKNFYSVEIPRFDLVSLIFEGNVNGMNGKSIMTGDLELSYESFGINFDKWILQIYRFHLCNGILAIFATNFYSDGKNRFSNNFYIF